MSRLLAVCSRSSNVFGHISMGLVNQGYAGEVAFWLAMRGRFGIITDGDDGFAINWLHRQTATSFRGKIGIGFNASRPMDKQVFTTTIRRKQIAVAIDAPKDVCLYIRELIENENDLELGVKNSLLKIKIPFVLVAATRTGLLAARSQGRKPLSWGKINNDLEGYYFASQSGVLGEDAQYLGSVLPGEMVFVNQSGAWHQMVNPRADQTRCLHEDLFQQRQDNVASGRPIYQLRQAVGHLEGRFFLDTVKLPRYKNVLAIQIPDGGLHFLLGFRDRTGYRIDPGAIVKNRYALPALGRENAQRIRVKYNVVEDAVRGKKIILIDDLVRSGTHMRLVSSWLRECGALEVHGVVSGILCHVCPYGNDDYTPYYEGKPRTAEDLGLDSLTYPPKDELLKVLSTKNRPRCGNCLC